MNKNRSNTPFLLIETPRAGKWNHRHIVAPGVPQQAYLDIIETARQKNESDNFLAVGHDNKVKQLTTDRYAPELLVLAGVDTKRLNKNRKRALQDSLASLLGSVDKLVTGDIDWDREGENDPVVREELAVWFNEQFKDVEATVWNPKSKRLSKKMMSTMTVILLVLLGGVGWNLIDWNFLSSGEDTTQKNENVVSAEDEKLKNLIEVFLKSQLPDIVFPIMIRTRSATTFSCFV